MSRPYVDLQTLNWIDTKRMALERLLEQLVKLDGIIGILLDGGLSRGYADELSEIDIVLFLDEDGYARHQNAAFPIAEGITVIDGELFDVKLVLFEEELTRPYDSVAMWDLSYAEVLYDPEKKLAGLIAEKLQPVDAGQAAGYMFDAWWHYRLAGDIWLKRQDAAQGHFVLNNAVEPLLGALFLCNREYIPHDKWLVHMSRTLEWTPDDWDACLNGMFSAEGASLQSLASRQAQIDSVWRAVNARLCGQLGITGVDITQHALLDALVYLAKSSPVPVQAWEEKYSLGLLRQEPFYTLARVTGGMVVLDVERLLALGPQEMYVWHYQVVEACKKSRRYD